MSRDGRDDTRTDPRPPQSRAPQPHAPSKGTARVPMDRLILPRGPDREPVRVRDHVYRLRESEARILATVGAFRVVRADDVQPSDSSRNAWTGDLRALSDQGLLEHRTVEINRESTAVVVLTKAGKDLLDAHQHAGSGREQ